MSIKKKHTCYYLSEPSIDLTSNQYLPIPLMCVHQCVGQVLVPLGLFHDIHCSAVHLQLWSDLRVWCHMVSLSSSGLQTKRKIIYVGSEVLTTTVMNVSHSSKTSVHIWSTWCYIPEDGDIQNNLWLYKNSLFISPVTGSCELCS